jgi:hypothetical protein
VMGETTQSNVVRTESRGLLILSGIVHGQPTVWSEQYTGSDSTGYDSTTE